MAIEPLGMDALLAKLNTAREAVTRMPTAASAAGKLPGVAGAAASTPVDFAALLKSSIASVDGAHAQATGLAERFQVGDPNVGLEDTMVALSKANISFQQMVQVRNRLVAAYHDIMNLQI